MSETVTVGVSIKDIDAKSQRDWKRTRYVLTAIVILAALATIFFGTSLLRFQLLTDAQSVISILTPLVLYSFFIERAIEVYLSVWRAKDSDALKLAVKQTKGGNTSAPAELYTLEHKLTSYKATTRDIAFVSGFIIGVLISLAGVRALALFVDPTSLSDLTPFQTTCFAILDVFITGALIGGGSDGMHKLVTMILALFDSTKAKALKNVE